MLHPISQTSRNLIANSSTTLSLFLILCMLSHLSPCSLEAALASPTIPPETVTSLLNLAEFMEHDDKSLPLDTRTLGALAEKCHAFAKALHYKVRVQHLAMHAVPGHDTNVSMCRLILISHRSSQHIPVACAVP